MELLKTPVRQAVTRQVVGEVFAYPVLQDCLDVLGVVIEVAKTEPDMPLIELGVDLRSGFDLTTCDELQRYVAERITQGVAAIHAYHHYVMALEDESLIEPDLESGRLVFESLPQGSRMTGEGRFVPLTSRIRFGRISSEQFYPLWELTSLKTGGYTHKQLKEAISFSCRVFAESDVQLFQDGENVSQIYLKGESVRWRAGLVEHSMSIDEFKSAKMESPSGTLDLFMEVNGVTFRFVGR
ncbi:hypothetical protein ACP3V3_16775 [Vibrio sp. PNB22_3_1]